jgi:hypothetical protein
MLRACCFEQWRPGAVFPFSKILQHEGIGAWVTAIMPVAVSIT